MYTFLATFNFKNEESKTKFIEFINRPNGFSITKNWPRCELLEVYQTKDHIIAPLFGKNGTI